MLQIFTLNRGKTKVHVSYYIILREKQKHHITSRSSKISWKDFYCGLCYDEIETAMNKLSKLNTEQVSKGRRRTDISYGFRRNTSCNRWRITAVQLDLLPYGIPRYQVFRHILFIRYRWKVSCHWCPSKSSVFKANLAHTHHGLLVSGHKFPGKTKAFKANLVYSIFVKT